MALTGDAITFGERLRRLRERAGLTQDELAERAALSSSAIAALERGRRTRPYPHTIRALADALDLSEPERAEFVGARAPVAANLVPAPPPPPAPPALPANLAAPLAPLIGREDDVAALAALIRGPARLLTLIGPGGVGKTRLALAVATAVADDYPGSVRFLDLTPLADPELLLPAILEALDPRARASAATVETVCAHLGARRVLLVLDNCEHLLGAVAQLAALLAGCAGLTVLATSRAPLRLRGEREYPVTPLTIPPLDRVPAPAEVEGNPAVRLFVERARAVQADFALTRGNAAAVVAICRRLDGLPLALELAAARIRLLNPTELLARLDRTLALLAGGARDLPARQRTMRDTIAWSYELLDPADRALFRRLAVFMSGWDLAAAEAVGGEEGADGEVLDRLGSLIEQSLVLPAQGAPGGAGRYRFLEPVREYARDQLAVQGEADLALRRHAAHFLTLAVAAELALEGHEQAAWYERLEMEHDNLRAALQWCNEQGEIADGLRLCWGLWRFWTTRHHGTIGRRWLKTLLECAAAPGRAVPPLLLVRANFAYGFLAHRQDDYAAAQEYGARALELARAIGHQLMQAAALNLLGHAAYARRDYAAARACYGESLALRRAIDDRRGIAIACGGLGRALIATGDLAGARALLLEGRGILEELGDKAEMGQTCFSLGSGAYEEGEDAEALGWFEESLAHLRAVGDRAGQARALIALGEVLVRRDDLRRGRARLEEGLALAGQVDSDRAIASGLEGFARLLAAEGEPARAVRLAGAAAALRRTSGVNPLPGRFGELAGDLAPARGLLGPEAARDAWAAGEQLGTAVAIAEALGRGAG